jgi:hypothetical protein
MPSLMATSLRWRTHSARTNYMYIVYIYLNSLTQWIDTLYLLSGTDKST